MKKCLEEDNQHYINFVDVIKQLEEMESKQQNTDSLKYRTELVCTRLENALAKMKKLDELSKNAGELLKDGFTAMEKLLGLAASIPDSSDIDLDSYSHILLLAEIVD